MIALGLTLAILLSWVGLYLIKSVWSQRGSARRHVLLAAWIILILAHCLAYAIYQDAGAAICLMATACVACFLVMASNRSELKAAISPEKKTRKRTRTARTKADPDISKGGRFRAGAVFLLAGPGAIIGAMSATLLIYQVCAHAGAAPADSIVIAFFAFPVLAAALSTYILMGREHLLRMTSWTGGLMMACAVLISIMGAY